jgi:hypothetical protein
VVIDPKDATGTPIIAVAVSSVPEDDGDDERAFLAGKSCFSFHHHSPNSTTTVPP